MTLVAFSSSRPAAADVPQPFEQLAVRLSGLFSTLDADEVEEAIVRAIADVGTAFEADDCTFIDLVEPGSPKIVAAWAPPSQPSCTEGDLADMPWLIQRLTRNAVVATTLATEFPHAAKRDHELAVRTGMSARLAVPVAVGSRVAFGLLIGSRHRRAQWETATADRLRLVGEILGNGLVRHRQDETLRASQATIERLSAETRGDALYLKEEARNQAEADQIIGESATLRVALSRLGQVAPIDATVLLLGETGTGKELFARALHDRSRRRDRALVRVNCAALPASLIESELFGHERGAFTGAVTTRQGRFELADGGTIFLDEIGDLAPELQTKLLRVLQEGEFERVGSSKTRSVDVRVIAGTHVDLQKAVAEGQFRADLYYRLSVFPITLPPLRERPDDIPQLVWFFIHRRQRDLGRRITAVPGAVMHALQRHDWPGNVRELENVIERAMIRSVDGTLQLDDRLRTESRPQVEPECGDSLDAVQRSHIERVLRECGWRINGVGNAAVRLGIHPNTLRFRIKKLGVVIPGRRGASPPSGAGRE